jgi:hypothetical protein
MQEIDQFHNKACSQALPSPEYEASPTLRMSTGGKRVAQGSKRMSASSLVKIMEEYHEEYIDLLEHIDAKLGQIEFIKKCLA